MKLKFLHLSLIFLSLCLLGGQTHAQHVLNFSITQPAALVVDAGLDTFIYLGDSIMLGASPTAEFGTPPYDYLWSPLSGLSDATASNPLAYPTSTTTYSLTVTDAQKCAVSDEVFLKVSLTDIGEMASHLDFQIYPNPSSGSFRLQLDGLRQQDELRIEIFSPLGQRVYEKEIIHQSGKYEEIITLDTRVKGVFIVRVSGENTMLLKQLIVY